MRLIEQKVSNSQRWCKICAGKGGIKEMGRLTGYDEDRGLIVREEERILHANGIITKDEMYKIMRHLAEKLAEYEDLEERGKLLKNPQELKNNILDEMNEFKNSYRRRHQSLLDNYRRKADAMEAAMRIVEAAFLYAMEER